MISFSIILFDFDFVESPKCTAALHRNTTVTYSQPPRALSLSYSSPFLLPWFYVMY